MAKALAASMTAFSYSNVELKMTLRCGSARFSFCNNFLPVTSILFRKLLRLIHHTFDVFVRQATLLRGDGNLLNLARRFVFRGNLKDWSEYKRVAIVGNMTLRVLIETNIAS